MTRQLGIIALTFLSNSLIASEPVVIDEATTDAVRLEFEEMAQFLSFFDPISYRYGDCSDFQRFCIELPRERASVFHPVTEIEKKLVADARTIRPLIWPKYDPTELEKLLRHTSPKVRTLAAAALTAIDRERYYERIAPLLDDEGETFPMFDRFAAGAPKSQAVGDVVDVLLGPENESFHNETVEWRKKTGRPYTCHQLVARYSRAFRAQMIFPEESRVVMREVEVCIDRTPYPDNVWYQIALARRETYVTSRRAQYEPDKEENLVASAKGLGHERLINALRRQVDTTDPSIQRPKDSRIRISMIQLAIRQFILDHAEELLLPSDVEFLLNREWVETDLSGIGGPKWSIAAARLAPDRAAQILNAALERWCLGEHQRMRDLVQQEIDRFQQ